MTDQAKPFGDYDALLVLSFGGPESNEDVLPFLRNVTKGRGIPDERLVEVGEHYYHFNGVSPLNRLNEEIIEHVGDVIKERGQELPIYFGNRNWHPFVEDTVKQMLADGRSNVLVFATSAWGGYSACLQYDEDIRKLREAAPEMNFTKLRQFYSHPMFIEEMAELLTKTRSEVEEGKNTRVLFTAHSVPNAADDRAGGEDDKNLYSRQVAEASRLIAEKASVESYDLVWQSRSGDPRTPWLDPDICDHTQEIAKNDGVESIVVCPVGFISDHMEVVWDLDTELIEAADEVGVSVHRVPTAGPTRRFAEMVVELIDEHVSGRPWAKLGNVTTQGCTVNGAPCAEGCCSKLQADYSA